MTAILTEVAAGFLNFAFINSSMNAHASFARTLLPREKPGTGAIIIVSSGVHSGELRTKTISLCETVSSSFPSGQILPKRLIHPVKRVCAKEDRLKVRRIVFLSGRSIQIKGPQLSLVHFRKFAGRRK